MIQVAIHGAAGRMGRRLIALLSAQCDDLVLAAAIDHDDHQLIGEKVTRFTEATGTDVRLTDQVPDSADVLIDFSVPVATRRALSACREKNIAMVIGTTGLTDQDHRDIDQAAGAIAILQAPSMSLAVTLLIAMAGQVARRLGEEYDIEIIEAHHRFKVDAPSGTALGIAQAICDATGKELDQTVVYGRRGDNVPRAQGEIGMHALRTGDVVSRHTVSFGTLGEELQLGHVTTSRDVFARGALRAARWLAGRPAGRYTMADVLGIED